MQSSTRARRPDVHYDAVVVGARCAGAAAALLLARRGLQVALVDRAPLRGDTLSTHALMRGGVMQLDRWGLLERVIAAGTPAVRRTVFHYGTATTTVTLKPLAGVDALYAPRRTVLDPILVEAAVEAGVDLLLGISVTDVERAADGRVIGVVGHDRNGDPLHVRARTTIGADGRDSTIARAVGAQYERKAAFASSFIYAYADGLATKDYEWFYAPGVTAGLIPTNNAQTCVWVGSPRVRFRAELAGDVRAGFGRLLAEASPDLAERVASSAVDGVRSHPGIPAFVRRPWGPGWALVGDAGFYTEPVTANGMSDAFRDAELLAGALTAVRVSAAPEASVMQQYADDRDHLSRRLFAATEAIASYTWDSRSVQGHVRSLSAAMADGVEHLLALDPRTAEGLVG